MREIGEWLLAVAAGDMTIDKLVRELDQHPAGAPACIVCELAAKAEAEALEKALSGLDLAAATEDASFLLCFPHLKAVAAKCADSGKVRLLIRRHAEAFKSVAENMRQYEAKLKNRQRNLITDAEQQAAWRGLMLLAGRNERRS